MYLLKRHLPHGQNTSVLGRYRESKECIFVVVHYFAETLHKFHAFIRSCNFKLFKICLFAFICICCHLLQVLFTKRHPKTNSFMWPFWCLIVCYTIRVAIWLSGKLFSKSKPNVMPIFFFVLVLARWRHFTSY